MQNQELSENPVTSNRLGVHALRQFPEYGMMGNDQSQESHANWSQAAAPLGLPIEKHMATYSLKLHGSQDGTWQARRENAEIDDQH